ncbi:hypothetical protein CONPUDRAFT_76353 [Coniophora puteana RWD-64-598 SS2]|uniref:Uncharacterized protein n=1 Tax=Coniophora puteana (strain RWD-64-598) TaxID=741705 RepID=A0A5M3MD48_CONPW|nr:uncharacterized protein CONPUDRAFT_76353 [Coniophora puteana RWD-64-598 SS2]EIW76770.1 hypothetical protein CONPUDRAFT_76353 [Coniophora puteana RWD-64-598 SS2]
MVNSPLATIGLSSTVFIATSSSVLVAIASAVVAAAAVGLQVALGSKRRMFGGYVMEVLPEVGLAGMVMDGVGSLEMMLADARWTRGELQHLDHRTLAQGERETLHALRAGALRETKNKNVRKSDYEKWNWVIVHNKNIRGSTISIPPPPLRLLTLCSALTFPSNKCKHCVAVSLERARELRVVAEQAFKFWGTAQVCQDWMTIVITLDQLSGATAPVVLVRGDLVACWLDIVEVLAYSMIVFVDHLYKAVIAHVKQTASAGSTTGRGHFWEE